MNIRRDDGWQRGPRCLGWAEIVLLAVLMVPGFGEPAFGADLCTAEGEMAGKKFAMKQCAVAYFEEEQGVTLWISVSPITAEERDEFALNSYPRDRDGSGKQRTMMHFAFCPGDGSPTPNPSAVKSVEMSFNRASDVMASRQWVFALPGDNDLRIEKLSGKLEPGGRLAGRIRGAKKSDGARYSWQVDFDLAIPTTVAIAGPGCSGW